MMCWAEKEAAEAEQESSMMSGGAVRPLSRSGMDRHSLPGPGPWSPHRHTAHIATPTG